MAEKLIPVAVAVELIKARSRADTSLAQHMVLHEAVALLIGRLHCAGVVDAHELAEELVQVFADPHAAGFEPGLKSPAETLAGRIRGAAHWPRVPDEDRPAGS